MPANGKKNPAPNAYFTAFCDPHLCLCVVAVGENKRLYIKVTGS